MINPTTGKGYSANNEALLEEAALESGYESNEVAGYTQWKDAGRQVKKGEKCTYIKYMVEFTNKKTGKKELKPRSLKLFFIEQTDLCEFDFQ